MPELKQEKEKRNVMLTLSIKPSTKSELQRLAEQNNRSLSRECSSAILYYIKGQANENKRP